MVFCHLLRTVIKMNRLGWLYVVVCILTAVFGKNIYMGAHGGLTLAFFIAYKEYGYVNVVMQLLTILALVLDTPHGYTAVAGVLAGGVFLAHERIAEM